MNDGSVFGLTIRGLPIDALHPAIPGSQELAWTCSRAPVPGPSAGWIEQDGSDVVVGWGGWADYRLTPSGEVSVRSDAVAADEAALAFVVSVLPLALPLFEREPLHASAVVRDGHAIVMLGASGAGKSTLSAILDERGLGFVADDACAFDSAGRLWPGPPLLNPRSDDLSHDVVGEYNGKRVRSPMTVERDPVAAQTVVVLLPEKGAPREMTPLAQGAAFHAILAHARFAWFLEEQRRSLQLEVVSKLATKRCAMLRFDPERDQPEATADAILEWSHRIA